MLRFAHSEYLYALYLVPVVVVLFWFAQRHQTKLLNNFANSKLHKVLFPLRSVFKSWFKFGLTLFAIVLLIISLANPQIGTKIEEVKQVGIDVFIVLDVSLSMKAEDIKPNRLLYKNFMVTGSGLLYFPVKLMYNFHLHQIILRLIYSLTQLTSHLFLSRERQLVRQYNLR